jgi:hypothetical protein
VEELIFFAVIIFFSIIESIARRRRQKGTGEAPQEGPFPGLPDPSEWESRLPEVEELPTYDQEGSYDDHVESEPPPSYGRPAPTGSAARPGQRPRSSSEEMLPGDLLEELSRMAGRVQERKARTLDLPRESPPLPEPVAARPVPVRRPTAVRVAPREHPVHRAHALYGTDPSSRPPSPHDTMDPLAERLGADARAVRSDLRSGDGSALRRAVILREVLGPPLAMRE